MIHIRTFYHIFGFSRSDNNRRRHPLALPQCQSSDGNGYKTARIDMLDRVPLRSICGAYMCVCVSVWHLRAPTPGIGGDKNNNYNIHNIGNNNHTNGQFLRFAYARRFLHTTQIRWHTCVAHTPTHPPVDIDGEDGADTHTDTQTPTPTHTPARIRACTDTKA